MESLHLAPSHHGFYDDVGRRLQPAAVPVGVQRDGELFGAAVVFRTGTGPPAHRRRHRLDPLRTARRRKKRVRTGRILTDAYRADPAHLDERPVGSDDLDDDHHGDADHGGQGQSPPEGDGPVGILVDLVVGQRLVLDQREDEAALTGGAERQQDTGTFCFKRWSFLPHTAEE